MPSNKPLNFILIGRSGSGKGTQAELLVKHFPNLIHLSTGDLMRDLAGKNTDAGARIKKILDEGGLPFDQMATTLWMHEISYSIKADQGIICDGFPRRLREAEDLYEFLGWLDRLDNTKVLLIDISEEEAIKRLTKRGRNDDDIGAIKKRLSWFEDRVAPAINFYQNKGILIKINGEQTIEEIAREILNKIE